MRGPERRSARTPRAVSTLVSTHLFCARAPRRRYNSLKFTSTVIITGTSTQGAVATTSNGATGRGYKAVVPVDGTASEDAFRELYGIFHLAGGGPAALTQNVTVTRSDLIKYAN